MTNQEKDHRGKNVLCFSAFNDTFFFFYWFMNKGPYIFILLWTLQICG